ncbi:hypothetical protein [Conexibacter sp. DBS9H8]|uniref:hypothetical protein n=1 Tax=Conexibacter sp. DBS9H8 TaxID=2937801 RepID=UPI00200E49FD|nr:hypothetical protein [Conexibacter sp. DBS9H8]
MPFHVELRDGREIVRAFNLGAEEVRARFLEPLRTGAIFTLQDKEFEPRTARLTVIEGERLAPGQLALGQGWTNAVKRGRDVTGTFLSASVPPPAPAALAVSGRLKERILGRVAAGPMALGDGLALTGDLLPGHRVSDRLAAVETSVWELLHAGEITLAAAPGSEALDRTQWEAVLLEAGSWLAPGPDSPVISATA